MNTITQTMRSRQALIEYSGNVNKSAVESIPNFV